MIFVFPPVCSLSCPLYIFRQCCKKLQRCYSLISRGVKWNRKGFERCCSSSCIE